MRSARVCSLLLAAALGMIVSAAVRAADAPAADEVAALVAQLGDADYAIRETAATRLAALGAVAADALLAAAETSDDIEVALRARWLVRGLPADSLSIGRPGDPPAVTALLGKLTGGSAAGRGGILHRLLRLDDDAGIEPLARIVRLDRSAAGSRTAAALLVDEWQPGDPQWPGIAERIARGIGTSSRPTAAFLRSLVEFSRVDSAADRGAAIAAARTAFARLEATAPGDSASEPVEVVIRRTFRRGLVQMLVAAERREEALTEADRLLVSGGRPESDDSPVLAELVWLAEHGLPETVRLVDRRWPQFAQSDAVAMYATALAWRRLGDEPEARRRAALAFEQTQGVDDAADRRNEIARMLVRWGTIDWATREYEAVLASPTTPEETFATAAMLFGEVLHDHEEHARAADVYRQLLTRGAADGDPLRRALEMELPSVRSRMLYFEACAAVARGDMAARRRLVEEAVEAYPKDVDALIALYRLPDNTPAQRAAAAAQVARAIEQIDAEIQALPEETKGYNEYAWLVANTEGDLEKATRYSRMSLEKSTDNSSFLDTLAHCHAAAGRISAAVRTQSLARRLEPHGQTIARNLERFRSQLPQQ
jgi:hypothetical protein